MTRQFTLMLCGIGLLAGCSKEPPPRSVTEFVDNPMLLEAAMVRCSRDRAESRYEAECVNAREAVKRIEAKEEAEGRAELEARSERKRQALRQTQQAAAEARRRAEEADRLRREAEYLAQFGVLPPADTEQDEETAAGNAPGVVIPERAEDEDALQSGESLPRVDGANAPGVSPGDAPTTELESVRDELRRRSEETNGDSTQ